MACYDSIIGLSQLECPCIVEGPDGFNESDSGIFLDQYDYVKMLQGFDDCASGSAWDILDRARSAGIKRYLNDAKAALIAKYSQRAAPFSGTIGSAAGRTALSTARQYVGIRLMPNPIRGGSITVTKIGMLFPSGTANGTRVVSIYNSLNQLVTTRTVNIGTGHVVTTLSVPIVLQTTTEYSEKHDYYLVYEHNAVTPSVNNTSSCGCGGVKSVFNTQSPTWLNGRQNRTTAWQGWVMAAGWQGDALTDFDIDDSYTVEQNNGMTLQIECGCDISTILCASSLNFNADAGAMSQAYAIYYAAAQYVIDAILRSDKLIRSAMINRDALKADKADFEKRYMEAVKYVVDSATLNNNDCLMCRETSGMRVNILKA